MQKFYPDRIIKKLANLQLAIALLLTIGIVVAIGTVIEQDQTLAFYQQNYTETKPILGFLTWKLVIFLSLDHVYTSYWFIILLFLFGASLMSCTLSVQLPVLRRLRIWKFYKDVKKVNGINNTVPINTSNNVVYQLHLSNYNVFRQGKKNYAYSGLLGRFGPIVVHTSIILLLVGSTIGSFGGYMAQEIVPRGEFFHTQNLIKFGSVSNIPQNLSWRVNDFWITYTEDFKTNQFYSDLSLLDNLGNELKRKTIFVNEPFVYKGLTLYQTDWDIVGIKLRRNDGLMSQLSLKKITKAGQKFWFGSINSTGSNFNPQQFSILINDLRGNIYIYDGKGTLVQESKLGQPVSLTESEYITFLDFLTSTGLQIKVDPGIRTVFLAFFLLMISTYASFISYAQIWSTETRRNISLAGNSNRAVLFFQTEFRKIIKNANL
jgi:cytochrome c biogenesis protein